MTFVRGRRKWRVGATFARVHGPLIHATRGRDRRRTHGESRGTIKARRVRRAGPPANRAGQVGTLFLQLPLQDLDLLGQRGVVVRPGPRSCAPRAAPWCGRGRRSGGRSPAASAASGLRQIHRHLARAHHVGGAARRQEVGAADIVLARHDALDLLDLDRAWAPAGGSGRGPRARPFRASPAGR